MKYFYLLIFAVLISSCGILKNNSKRGFVVTVIDQKNNLPIDSAKIQLITMTNTSDLIYEDYYTDSDGKCNINVSNPIPYPCHIGIRKPGYHNYLNVNDSVYNDVFIEINENTPREMTYLLTSDSLNHYKYLKAKIPRYEPGQLMNMIKSNEFSHLRSPSQLRWGDIPKLLEYGRDTTITRGYQMNPISSMGPIDCYVGVVSLWYIEIIRLTANKGAYNLHSIYPSQTPTLDHFGEFPYSDKELMNQAYFAYYSWWQKVKYMDRHEACKIDPLENTKVHWQKDLNPQFK